MRNKNITLYLSILLNVLTIPVLVFLLLHYNVIDKVYSKVRNAEADTPTYLLNREYSVQLSKYETYKNTDADFIMLGDSITFAVNWEQLLDAENVINQGIGNDTTEGILNRLIYVTELSPKKVFLMAGINDLLSGVDVNTSFNNYKKIIEHLNSNNIVPIVQSTLYVSQNYPRHIEINEKVAELNNLLKEYSIMNDYEYLDLNKELSPNGTLEGEYTYDGVHLNGQGYMIWGSNLDSYIK